MHSGYFNCLATSFSNKNMGLSVNLVRMSGREKRYPIRELLITLGITVGVIALFFLPSILMVVGLTIRDKEALPESGFIDHSGNFAYHELNTVLWNFHYSEGLLIRPWGNCIDKQGKVVFRARYSDCEDFSEGLAAFCKERTPDEWGFVDKKGSIAIAPEFENAHSFSQGFAPVKQSGRWGFIDKTGKWLVKPKFENARPFFDGMAAFQQNGKIGYIDTTGTIVIAPEYDVGMAFSEGVAQVAMYGTDETPGTVQFIDKKGKLIENLNRGDSAESYSRPSSMNFYEPETLFASSSDNESKSTGSFEYPGQRARQFRNDRLQFCKGELYGYLDKQGNVVVPVKYTSAKPFSENLACVSTSERMLNNGSTSPIPDNYGFIDINGKFVIEPIYQEASNFHEGLAFVKQKNGIAGFIDKKGRMVIPIKSGAASDFYDGLAAVGPHLYYP